MATISAGATNCGWNVRPVGGAAGTGISLDPACADDGGIGEVVGTRTGSAGSSGRDLLAGLALGGGGIASILAGKGVGARIGAAGIGRGVGIALGIGALAGAAFLLHRSQQNATTEYLVNFATEPDLDGVAPGDVYATLRAHHERYAPAVERELGTMLDEGKVRSFSGIIGANGFVVDVVNRHRDEVQQRLAALSDVGGISEAELI